MQGKIEDTTFKDFVVPFGGAFYIVSSIDLDVKKLNIFNINSFNYITIVGVNGGGPGFIFSGNGFHGSHICANNLSTSYSSIFLVYTSSSSNHAINSSCVSACDCLSYSIILGQCACVSDSVNVTECSSKGTVSTIHYGWHPSSYYQENFIGRNNTGPAIFGHSCSSTAEQKCLNIVLIDNTASLGVIGFWNNNHRLVNSYFLRNTICKLYKFNKNAVVTFERCFNEGITDVTEVNPKTSYQTSIDITRFNYEEFKKKMIKETCKKLNRRTCAYHRHEFKAPVTIYIIIISQ